VTKERRTEIKQITEELNKTKAEIDRLKQRLDRKENERRMRL
jgi:ubiquinone biosynthesis protein UbiJ